MSIRDAKKVGSLGAALIGVLILAMISGFQPLYWLVYLVVGGTVTGYLWGWIQSRGLEARVQELSAHPQVGQSVLLNVTVRERVGFPRVGLRARLGGDIASSQEQVFSLWPRSTASWTVSGICHRRGINSLGPLAMISSDPAGFLRLECRSGQTRSILVHPATVEVSRTVVEGQAIGGQVGEVGQLISHSPTASMVRQYVPGDSLAHVHWPSTARTNQLMTKEFEGAGISEIWLFVDLHEELQVGAGNEGTEEYAITIAASLAKGLIESGYAVGLVMQGDQFYRFSPNKDTNHLLALFRALALVRAKGQVPLSDLMEQESGSLGAGTVAMVVTPRSGQGMGSVLQFLTRRGILAVPILLQPASFGRQPDTSRPTTDEWVENHEWALVVKKGDSLSRSLGTLLDRLASY